MRTFIFMLALIAGLCARGQSTGLPATNFIAPDSMAASLARIALEYNGATPQDAGAKAAKYEWRTSRTSWMDNLRIAGNVNEFSISNDPIKQNTLYPRYNIGAVLPLGIFVNQGKQAKAMYYRYQAEKENLNKEQQALRFRVMTAYYDYLKAQKILELQEEMLQEALFAREKAEEKFAKGQITLEVYTSINKRHNTEQISKLTAERDLAVTRAELETYIGMPLQKAYEIAAGK
jgi:outer membrane protein TolC